MMPQIRSGDPATIFKMQGSLSIGYIDSWTGPHDGKEQEGREPG